MESLDRVASTRSLYHGTLLDHLPSIQQHGLIPEVGPFVSDAYDLNEPSNWMAFSPEEVGVEPVAFMADKKRLGKALNAIQFNVAKKLNKTFPQVTPLDVRNHGLLLKLKGKIGAQDPPMNYVWDEQHEEPFEEGPRSHQPRGMAGEGPYQAEPGDYYSQDPIGGLEYIHGPALMKLLYKQGMWHGHPEIWNIHPEGWQEPAAGQEVYGAWHFAMPVGEDYWQQWQRSKSNPKIGDPTGELYHGTSPTRLESIMRHGIYPWDSSIAGGTVYKDMPKLQPRPGHVYLSQDPYKAYDRGLDSSVEDLGPGAHPLVLKIDPTYLDPQHINPDEDNMPGIVDKDNYPSSGAAAEAWKWGDLPSETEREMERGRSIGYRGVIPPEALTPGTYQNGAWQPIEWPQTASVISDMRDGWGRFASGASWQFGTWGKGIFYPETGTLQTWGDDRTHPEVALEDENAAQGNGHHIIIRPNGTVKDQDAMNTDSENVEGDMPALVQALRELDPRLRLDKPSDSAWEFGVTEPIEEEPSAISRGEKGGTTNDVQTSNDYAGSL